MGTRTKKSIRISEQYGDLEELRKSLNFIQLESKLKLDNSFGATLKGHEGCVTSVILNSNGTKLASSSVDSTIKIWDLVSKTEILH